MSSAFEVVGLLALAEVEEASGTEDELIAFASERLAAYKRPGEVHVVGELPKTQTGKIRRRELRDEHTPSHSSTPTEGN